jgi:tetratricopeptide (TPR) repeat protein
VWPTELNPDVVNLPASAAQLVAIRFETAAAEGGRVLEMFPNSQLYRANFALYAMYSGEFETAAEEARTAIDADPAYGTSYLPLAVSLIAMGDYAGARDAYERM